MTFSRKLRKRFITRKIKMRANKNSKRKNKNKSKRRNRFLRKIFRGGAGDDPYVITVCNLSVGIELFLNKKYPGRLAFASDEVSQKKSVLDENGIIGRIRDACIYLMSNYDVCEKFQCILPIYFKQQRDPEVQKYFCMVFLLIGFLNIKFYKMNMCTLVLKGGKSIQTVLRDSSVIHASDDMDITIITKNEFDGKEKEFAVLIGGLLSSIFTGIILNQDVPRLKGSIVKISLQLPSTSSPIPVVDIGYDSYDSLSPVITSHETTVVFREGINEPFGLPSDFSSSSSSSSSADDKINYWVGYLQGCDEEYKADILFTFIGVNMLLQEFLHWLLKYHMENRQRQGGSQNAAFLIKSKKSINVLLDYISREKQKDKLSVLDENIDKVCAYHLDADESFCKDVDLKKQVIEEVNQMILENQERERLFLSPTPDSKSPTCIFVPRVKTPLTITSKEVAPTTSVYSPQTPPRPITGDPVPKGSPGIKVPTPTRLNPKPTIPPK
jgi:hypothetical protein